MVYNNEMDHSRREIALLLSVAALAQGQTDTLPSKMLRFEDLPVRGKGPYTRAGMNGMTHKGWKLEMHQTELNPGQMPHAAHHHVHEEIMLVREGTMEVKINDKTQTLGPGGIVYVASNEEHGWKNIGSTQAHYFVIAIGQGQ